MSKRINEHPEPKAGQLVGQKYWRSLDEKAATPEFKNWLDREFPEGAAESIGFNRRHFLKMMGASFGLAGLGLAGCREPILYTFPYSKQPENHIPGVPLFFATSFPGARGNQPLLVETHQYRPTKIEGNSSYTPNGNASSKYAQASVLELYDVDRATGSQNASGRLLPKDILLGELRSIAGEAAAVQGEGFVFLAQPSASPTRARLVAKLKKKLPKAVWAEYTPVAEDAADVTVSKLAGRSVRIRPDFSKAKRVLSLDADFLDSGDDATAAQRSFAQARRIDDPSEVVEKMNRLYSIESTFTLTGAQADHRLRASASSIPAITALIVAEVLTQTGGDMALAASLKSQAAGIVVDPAWIKESVADLVANKGASLIVAGDHLPESVHALVALANARIGAEGKTVNYVASDDVAAQTIADVTAALSAGKVKTLVVLGGNPVYDAPADLEFAKTAKAANVRVVRLGYYGPSADETSFFTKSSPGGIFVASSHYLESWGDGRAPDGTYVPVQPMIEPLFPSINEIDFLAPFAGVEGDAYALVKETFAAVGGENFEAWLAEGVLPGSGYKAVPFVPSLAGVAAIVGKADFKVPAISKDNVEVRIVPSSHAYDGRYANNGWLAESPDAMFKTNWENVIAISPKLAADLDIEPKAMFINKVNQLNRNINQLVDGQLNARVAKLTIDGRTIEGPLFILPGMPDYTVSVQLGFGRSKVGRIGTRVIDAEKHLGTGYDAYPMTSFASPALAAGVKLELTDKVVVVANTQDHWSMEGRDIIREANVAEYAETPNFVNLMGPDSHAPKVYGDEDGLSLAEKSLQQPRGNSSYEHPAHNKPMPNVAVWKGHDESFPIPQQWGMSIDLNTCTGCNACVIACQAENNIPIVGRDQTLKGRDMRWIRLDRYFFDGRDQKEDSLSLPADPQVSFMSIACMQCETAPCESVCPANATVHDAEGLNTMAYNRCIGTRYCANNCPYKVRRFNFLDYSNRQIGEFYKGPLGPGGFLGGKALPELPKMQKNPNVSIRMRGVMEKCTFCIQRIQEAKIKTKVAAGASGDVRVKDGTIKVACEQVCASESIIFGDISDENSAVSKAKRSKRDYGVLTYLNTRPRTTYLAKLRNPNPQMPQSNASFKKLLKSPLSKTEYNATHGSHGDHGDHGHGHDHAHDKAAH